MSGRAIAHKFLTVSTFLSVLAAMGCGYSPVSPSQDDTTPGVESPEFVLVLSASAGSSGRDMMMTPSTSVSMVISAETGGTVTNGYVSLYFPPGALSEDTEITIDMPRYPEAMVELGPHGIVFNKNVTMTMPLDKLDSDAVPLEHCGTMRIRVSGRISVAASEDGNIVTELEHFSEYGHLPTN